MPTTAPSEPGPPDASGFHPAGAATGPAARRPYPAPRRTPPIRPRIVDEPGILGLSRRSRSRFGSRVFTLFFVAVFALILVQMVAALLYG